MHGSICTRFFTTLLVLIVTRPASADETPTSAAPVTADTSPLVIESVLNAPVADVWRILSTADGYRKLGVAQCELDLRVGGRIRMHDDPQGVIGDDGTIEQEILAFEPQRMIAFRLRKPPANFPFSEAVWKPTWSVWTFTDLGGGRTLMRLTGMGYAASPESQAMRASFVKGNTWVLQQLHQEFETAASGAAAADDPLAPVRHDRVIELPRDVLWQRIATGAGWKQFFGVDATIELQLGGRFEIIFVPQAPAGQRGSEGCTVLGFVPEEMLSFTWNAPPHFAHARPKRTWVVVRLERLSDKRTRVRLDHLGFAEMAASHPQFRAEWQAVRAYFQRAWGQVLDAIQAPDETQPPSAGRPAKP